MRNNWTKEQEDELILLIAQGKTNEQIARALGRTKSAVAHKRARLFKEAEEPEVAADVTPEDIEEDPDGEGSTEIERVLAFLQEQLDDAIKVINANAEILEKNMATMLTRTNELSKEKTVHEDELAELKQRAGYMAENLWQIDAYLSRGSLYRLFHSFRKYREGFPNGKRKS